MKDGITEREMNLIVKNEAKWREFMIRKIEQIEKDQNAMVVTMTTIKIKIGFISGIFGTVAGLTASIMAKKLGG